LLMDKGVRGDKEKTQVLFISTGIYVESQCLDRKSPTTYRFQDARS
jgi:hypothetical protein